MGGKSSKKGVGDSGKGGKKAKGPKTHSQQELNDVLKKESEADRQAGWTEVREGCFRSRLALALCRTKSDAGEVVSDVREIFTGVAACLETPRSACTRADIASNVCNLLKFSRIYMAS